jgi:hypothetical protein
LIANLTSASNNAATPSNISNNFTTKRTRFPPASKPSKKTRAIGRSSVSTALPDDSFAGGSAIFDGAGLDASSIFEDTEGHQTPGPIENPRPSRKDLEREEQRATLHKIARTPVVVEPDTADEPLGLNMIQSCSQWLFQKGDQALDLIGKLASLFWG